MYTTAMLTPWNILRGTVLVPFTWWWLTFTPKQGRVYVVWKHAIFWLVWSTLKCTWWEWCKHGSADRRYWSRWSWCSRWLMNTRKGLNTIQIGITVSFNKSTGLSCWLYDDSQQCFCYTSLTRSLMCLLCFVGCWSLQLVLLICSCLHKTNNPKIVPW